MHTYLRTYTFEPLKMATAAFRIQFHKQKHFFHSQSMNTVNISTNFRSTHVPFLATVFKQIYNDGEGEKKSVDCTHQQFQTDYLCGRLFSIFQIQTQFTEFLLQYF